MHQNATKCRWLITIYGGYGYKMAIKPAPPFSSYMLPMLFFSQFMNRSTTLHPSSGGFLESCGSWCCPLMAFGALNTPLGWRFLMTTVRLVGPKSQNPGEKISSNLHPLPAGRQDPAFGKAPSASAPCSASKLPGSCRCISCSAKLSCEAYRKIAMSATKIWNLRKKNWKFRFLPTRMNT